LSSNAQLAHVDFREIVPPQPASDTGRIVVTEFFSYQCPHCYAFDPVLHDWLEHLPADVTFERVPISIGHTQWTPIARTFFTLKAMGALDSLHTEIFRAIHVDGARLYDKASIVSWVGARGVDREQFSAIYDSFGVDTSVRKAEQSARDQKVFSVPSLSIDGRYLVMIYDSGGSERQLAFGRQLDGVSELIERVRGEKSPDVSPPAGTR